MPEYLSPGVYIEELAGAKPIEGVGTSTGAFVGIAEQGPINDPQLITNLTQFADTFGGFLPGAFLAYGVNHFFTEGGTRCYVVRAFKPTPPDANQPGVNLDLASVVLRKAKEDTSDPVMTVFALSEGTWANNKISVRAEPHGFDPADPALIGKDQVNKKFKLSVFYDNDPTPVEVFDQLSANEFLGDTTLPNPDHVEKRINGISKLIKVVDVTGLDKDKKPIIDPPFFPLIDDKTGETLPLPQDQAIADVLPTLKGGQDGGPLGVPPAKPEDAPKVFMASDLIGQPATSKAKATGLQAFDAVDGINIVSIPDLVNPAFGAAASRDATGEGFNYCEKRKDCFFVADAVSGLSPQQALAYKRGIDPSGKAFNTKFGAIYYPWIYTTDPLTGKRKLVPPSGAVAGSYAEADGRVGVHKAPAGTEDGYLNSAVEVERVVTKGEQDTLNPEGVNVIRKFADAGIVIWGARTVSSDPEWKYVNVRRLFNYLEQSILKGTQGLVFEPNDPSLWKRITRDISAFLKVEWMNGKIIGDKPEKAFFVHCNEETNTPETIDLGQVITLIGVCPSKPAEFVIFRIKQTRFGGDVAE